MTKTEFILGIGKYGNGSYKLLDTLRYDDRECAIEGFKYLTDFFEVELNVIGNNVCYELTVEAEVIEVDENEHETVIDAALLMQHIGQPLTAL